MSTQESKKAQYLSSNATSRSARIIDRAISIPKQCKVASAPCKPTETNIVVVGVKRILIIVLFDDPPARRGKTKTKRTTEPVAFDVTGKSTMWTEEEIHKRVLREEAAVIELSE